MKSKTTDYMKALCSGPPVNDQTHEGNMGGGDGCAFSAASQPEEALPSPMTGKNPEKEDLVDKKEMKKETNLSVFMCKLVGVNPNIRKLKEHSLFGHVIGEPMEMEKLVKKIEIRLDFPSW